MDLLIVCVITQLINTAGTISSHITPDIFLLLQVGFELSRVIISIIPSSKLGPGETDAVIGNQFGVS